MIYWLSRYPPSHVHRFSGPPGLAQDRSPAEGPAFFCLGAHLHDAARRALGRRLGLGSILRGLHAGNAAHVDRQLWLGEETQGFSKEFFFLHGFWRNLDGGFFRGVFLDFIGILLGLYWDFDGFCIRSYRFRLVIFVGINFLKSWHGMHQQRFGKMICSMKIVCSFSRNPMLSFQACPSLTAGTNIAEEKGLSMSKLLLIEQTKNGDVRLSNRVTGLNP